MRIVLDGVIYGRNPNGGITRYWTEVLAAISRMNVSIRLDLILPKGVARPAGLPCLTAGSLSASLAVARADIFHTSYYSHWPRMNGPSVVTVYDYIDASFPLLRPNEGGFVDHQLYAIRGASVVITISQSSRELTLKLAGIDPSRIFVAYPAVAFPFSLPPPCAEEIKEFRRVHTGGAPYLVHVGSRKNYKNFWTLLRAFGLAAQNTDRHLLILGGGHSLTTEELDFIISARLLDRVHFYPAVDDATLRQAYAGADAIIHASLMEGFGIPVIEALACGTGLILSDIPVYREIAGGRASFVEATDIEAWGHAMKSEVFVHPSWREEVLRQYTWEAAAQVHLSAYKSILP
ncbi:MAG: glycosyltransferase family 1 protein [bacterium]